MPRFETFDKTVKRPDIQKTVELCDISTPSKCPFCANFVLVKVR